MNRLDIQTTDAMLTAIIANDHRMLHLPGFTVHPQAATAVIMEPEANVR
jgi:hypothetical protein